jgi:ribosomal protein S18 acetylase RimI-like enzyme
MLRYTDDPTRVMFVAEMDGDVVAQGCGYIDPNHVAHFISVYVAPRLRGRGVVDLLADRVFAWARERGCDEIRLEVAAVNGRAVAAYRRLGFELTGRSQPHPLYPEAGVEVEMSRPL